MAAAAAAALMLYCSLRTLSGHVLFGFKWFWNLIILICSFATYWSLAWPADCPSVFLLLGRYSKSERSSLQKYGVCSIYFLTGVAKLLSSCNFTQQWGWLETWNLSTWATGLTLVVVSSTAKAACFLSARGIWFALHCLSPFFPKPLLGFKLEIKS